MKKLIVAGSVLAIALGFASPSGAFGCPAHFVDAQAPSTAQTGHG